MATPIELLCRLHRLTEQLPAQHRMEGALVVEGLAKTLGLDHPAILLTKLTPTQLNRLSKPLWPEPPTPVLEGKTKSEQWFHLLKQAEASPVCKAHIRPLCKLVMGTGPLTSPIMLVGEAPGAEEELKGVPFVGPAGQVLNEAIAMAGYAREQAYITNILLWRPETPDGKGNRPPTQDEMRYCLGYLKAQIAIVKPTIIVALGATAIEGILGKKLKITQVRGQLESYEGVPVLLAYHPSYVLRVGTRAIRQTLSDDIKKAFQQAFPIAAMPFATTT